MATATVGILRVILSGNSAEFESAMKRASGAAQAMSKDLGQIGRQATQIGSALTKTITLPILALGVGSVKAAMDFESSFANVAKTVDGVSDKFGQLKPAGEALAMTFRNMAKEIPATTEELTKIAALGGQMGVPIQNLEKFTLNVAALGVAVDGIGAEEAAMGLAQIANVFGDKEVKNIDLMSSALVHLGNNSNATEADILEFTKRLSGAGNAAGMTIPEVMAIGTAMANVGINAEAGGTAMSTMIQKMSMAVSEGGTKLKAFDDIVKHTKQSFTDLWKGSPTEAVNAVVVGLGNAKKSGEDLNLVVRDIGATNIRTADTMKRLAGAGDSIAVSLGIANEGWSTGNKHLEEAEKKYATTANQMKILWNHITDVGITIGNALLPAIKSMIGMLTSLMPMIDGMANAFAALPGGLQAVVVGLGLAVAAAGPLIWAFGQLALSASALTGAFAAKGLATRGLVMAFGTVAPAATGAAGSVGLLGGAIALLLNPITLTIAALGILGYAIYATATAETELEKEFKANADAFNKKTDSISHALKTYDELRGKQHLTTEETKRLEEATRILANASGLSTEAFNREAGASSKLTDELWSQTRAREAARAQFVQQSRDEAVAAQKDLARIQAELDKVKSGEGTKAVAQRFKEGGMSAAPMDMNERKAEIDRLTASLEGAKQKAKETQEVWAGLSKAATLPEEVTTQQFLAMGKNAATATQGVKGVGAAAGETSEGLQKAAERAKQYTADMGKLTAAEKASVVTQNKQGVSLKQLATDFKVNEDSLDRYVKSLKEGEKSSKAHTTATDKQAEALEKLGVVTAGGVNKSLGELAGLVKLATDAGVPLDNVLATMVPRFKELHEKAKASGAGVREAAAALDEAEAAAKRLAAPLLLLSSEQIPLLGRTFKDTADFIARQGDVGAQAVTDSFKFFGLNTREELAKTEREAIANFNLIKASGKATPEQIKKAFDEMNDAIRKNGGNAATELEDAYKRAGITTQKELDDAAFQAVLDFNLISNSADATAADIEASAKKMEVALVAAGDKAASSWMKNLGSLAGPLAELGKAVGGTTGTALSGVSNVLGAYQSYQTQGKLTGTQKAGALISGAASVWSATGQGQGKGQGAMSGAMAGMQAGMVFGPYGAAIGAAAGALVGFVRGMNDGREAVKKFAAEFGGFEGMHKELSRMGAEGEKIWINLTQKISSGDVKGAEKAIGEARQALAEFGTESERTEKRLAGIGMAIEGVNAKATLFGKAFQKPSEEIQEEIADIKEAMAEIDAERNPLLGINHPGALSDEEKAEADRLDAQWDALNAKLKTVKGSISELGAHSQAEFERIGIFAGAAFAGMVKETGDAIGAIQQLGPTLTVLKQGVDEFGLSGTGAINSLLGMFDLVNSEVTGPILSNIQATGQIFAGLRDGGLMTADLFQTVATDIGASFRDLEAKGGDVSKAMALSQPVLQDLWEAQEKYGTVTDETTLKLLAQAEEQGLVGADMKDVNDKILDVLLAIAEVFGATIPDSLKKTQAATKTAADIIESNMKAAGKTIEDNFAAAGKSIEDTLKSAGRTIEDNFAKIRLAPLKVPIEYDDPGYAPSGQSAAPASTGGFVTSTGIQYRALGGPINWTSRGTDTVPAMLTPGEGVASKIGMEGLHLLNSGRWLEGLKADVRASVGSSDSITGPTSFQSVTIMQIDKREVGRAVADVLPGELRRLGVRVRA